MVTAVFPASSSGVLGEKRRMAVENWSLDRAVEW